MLARTSGTGGRGVARQSQPVGPAHGYHGASWCGEDGAVVGGGEAVGREEALPVSGMAAIVPASFSVFCVLYRNRPCLLKEHRVKKTLAVDAAAV